MPTTQISIDQIREAAQDMYEALKAYELLDDQHANCGECDGIGKPEECEVCFDFVVDARGKMRAAIAKAEGK